MKKLAQIIKLLPAQALVGTLLLFDSNSVKAGTTGMFGLARGQIARINAVHAGDTGLAPIQFEIDLLDVTGSFVARNIQTLNPRQATFFDVAFNKLTIPVTGNRIELRAVVRAIGNPDISLLRTTVEVFESDTGKSTIFIGNPEI
jgi:hypothetical protein